VRVRSVSSRATEAALIGGVGVEVGGIAVAVGIGVAVGGTGVAVGSGAGVGGAGVAVGRAVVAVGCGVAVGVAGVEHPQSRVVKVSSTAATAMTRADQRIGLPPR
jgi:hypothetical protein